MSGPTQHARPTQEWHPKILFRSSSSPRLIPSLAPPLLNPGASRLAQKSLPDVSDSRDGLLELGNDLPSIIILDSKKDTVEIEGSLLSSSLVAETGLPQLFRVVLCSLPIAAGVLPWMLGRIPGLSPLRNVLGYLVVSSMFWGLGMKAL